MSDTPDRASIFGGKQLDALRWKEPEAQKLTPHQKAAAINSRRLGEAVMSAGHMGGDLSVAFVSPEMIAAADERAAAQAASKAAEEAAVKEAAECRKQAREIERQLRNAEGRAQRERLSAECARIEADRRARGKRELEPSELRAKAAKSLYKAAQNR